MEEKEETEGEKEESLGEKQALGETLLRIEFSFLLDSQDSLHFQLLEV